MDPSSQNMVQQIISYRESLGKGLKSGSNYPIDTAVRYTEALINYTYADVANNLEGLYVDSIFVDVALTGGQITPGEAASVYNDIIDSLTVQYQNLPSQNLHLVFADVFSRDSVAGEVTFGVISGFGYGSPISYGSFGENDWWMFGWAQYINGGYCGESEYEGTHTNDDAANQIEKRIRLHIGVPAGRKYPIDVVSLQIWPEGLVYYIEGSWAYYCDLLNKDDQYEDDNLYDYLVMGKISNQPNFDPCLTPDEMNFYWDGTDEVSNELLFECEDISNLIEDKSFMSISILGDNTTTTPYYWYVHQLTNVYGHERFVFYQIANVFTFEQ